MKIEREAHFSEAMESYERENHKNPAIGVGRDYLMTCANKRWYLGHLCHEDVSKVMVPGHVHGSVALVPIGSWVSVAEAVERFGQFKEQMPKCSESVNRHANLDYSKTHVYLEKTSRGLQHLDGFHRLIAYVFFNRTEGIPAFVATAAPLV